MSSGAAELRNKLLPAHGARRAASTEGKADTSSSAAVVVSASGAVDGADAGASDSKGADAAAVAVDDDGGAPADDADSDVETDEAQLEARFSAAMAYYAERKIVNLMAESNNTRVEKQFGNLLRGADVDDEGPPPPKVHRCSCSAGKDAPTAGHADDCAGFYQRFMSSSGSYLYCHSITCEIKSSKPDDFVDPDEEARLKALASGLRACPMKQMTEELEAVHAEGKVPLILDPSEDGKVAAYFQYKGTLVDAQKLCRSPVVGGMPAKEAMEQMRQALVAALKGGNTMCLSCGSSKIKWSTKYTSDTVFPAAVWESPATMSDPKVRRKFYRQGDLEAGTALAKPDDFRFVVLYSFTPDDYLDILKEELPLDKMAVVHVF